MLEKLEKKQTERINWIDWAKVIGITLVVLGHCSFDGDELISKNFI